MGSRAPRLRSPSLRARAASGGGAADLNRRWIWTERLLFGGGLVLLLGAVALLVINTSSLPARWAEESLAAALPGARVELDRVHMTGFGSLDAAALRLDLDGDGLTDFSADQVSIGFNLLRWFRAGGEPLAALETVTARGLHARLVLPGDPSPAALVEGPSDPGMAAGAPAAVTSRDLADSLARLPEGVHLRVQEAEVIVADAAGELTRLAVEGDLARTRVSGRDALQVSLAVEETSGARLGAELQVPVDPAGSWSGEIHLAGDLSASWVPRLLGRVDGWPQAWQLAGVVGVDGTISGPGSLPHARLEVRGAPVAVETGWNRYRFERLTGRLSWGGNGLVVESLELEDGPATVEVSGRILASGPELDVGGEGLPVDDYLPFLDGWLEGEATLASRLSGSWGAALWEGSLTAVEPRLLGGEVERIEAEFRWAGEQLQVSRAYARAGSGILEGSGWWRPDGGEGGELEARVTSEGFALQALLAARQMGLGGRVDGEAVLQGPVAGLAVGGRVSSSRLTVGPATFDRVEGSFSGTWSRLRVEQFTARRVDGGSYRVTGWIGSGVEGAGPGGRPGLDLEVTVQDESLPDVAALLGYEIPSYLLTGRFDGQAQVAGNPANPTGSARLELKEGPILGEELVTQLDLRFGDGGVRVERLRRHPLRSGLNGWTPS